MPGFDEAAVPDANNRNTRCGEGFSGGAITAIDSPAERNEIAFAKGEAGRYAHIGKTRLECVVEGIEFVGPADLYTAVVQNTIRRKQLRDSFAAALIPNFFKPADEETAILLYERDRFGRRGHERCGSYGTKRNYTMCLAWEASGSRNRRRSRSRRLRRKA